MKDQLLNAFKNENEDDIDNLDIQGKYKKWREDDLQNKATKIQKVFRGRSVREGLNEGINEVLKVPDEEAHTIRGNGTDIIEVGKAKRNRDLKAIGDENTLKNRRTKAVNDFTEKVKQRISAKNEEKKLEELHEKELGKQLDRQKFMAQSGIDDYAEKGQRTKERKRQEKQQEEEERNKKALAIQKVFRGKQSRMKNDKFSDDKTRRYIMPNPDYDPKITDPNDTKSFKNIYNKPIVTSNEAKIIKYNKAVAKQQRERSTHRRERLEREENERQSRIEEMGRNILFQDQDERSLKQKLSAAYPKNVRLKPKHPVAPSQEALTEHIEQMKRNNQNKKPEKRETFEQKNCKKCLGKETG